MAVLSPVAKQQFHVNGVPAAGYKLYTYATGTSTPQATYSDRAGASANTNPIILDSDGYATLYLTQAVVYDYVLKTAGDVTVWTRTGVDAGSGNADGVTFTPPGTGGVDRTADAKFGEVVTDVDYGAVGNGSTDDNAALTNAMNAAVAAGRTLTLDGTKTYGITGFLSFPAGLRMHTNGATFRDLAGTTSNTPFITVGESNWVDEIRVEIPTGIRRDRAVLVTSTNPQIERVVVVSAGQQANTGDNDDGAVRVSVSTGARIQHISVTNYDRAVIFKDSADLRVWSVQVDSYVRGLLIEDCERSTVESATIRTASANASYTAGHVGVLLSSNGAGTQHNLNLLDFTVEDAGEHGIRVGGDGATGAGYNENIHIVRPIIKNCGGSGIKILGTDSGTPAATNKRIFISDPLIEDCGSGTVTDNMCGILVMYTDIANITNPVIRKVDKTVSCSTGIRVCASTDVTITNPRVRDAQNDGIYLDGSLGALTRINIEAGGWSRLNGRDGYRLSGFNSDVTDPGVDGLHCFENSGLGFTIATTGSLHAGRPSFRFFVGSNTGGAGACDLAYYTLHIEGGVGATPLSGIYARNGSTWNDHTNFNVMKAGAWTAL